MYHQLKYHDSGKQKEFLPQMEQWNMKDKKNHEQNLDPQEAQWMNYQIPQIPQQHVVMSGHYQVPQPLPLDVIDTVYLETLRKSLPDLSRKEPESKVEIKDQNSKKTTLEEKELVKNGVVKEKEK
ncbi:unnamed protein product [Lactuca saligna]|uniref:Uncharacterized protein n=1 Tax=Lactuca saligna TaxID=75948 RepID=A0AA35ZVZ6_LACSI|nr:unnamed protein product [Lactuca saligna]